MNSTGGKVHTPIRVGIIGANPDRGWATTAHLPALAVMPEFETVAVASTRLEGARAVAQRWNVRHAFDDAFELITCPDVEVVVISVKGPDHAPLVRACVDAGKHIYCEWPLGVDLAEARQLTELVENGGGHHMIGMQAYESPGARFVGELVHGGTVGSVVGTSLVLLTPSVGGREVAEAMTYTTDRRSGVNILTTSTGHALAALTPSVGHLIEVCAVTQVVHSQVRIIETGAMVPNDAPNEVAIIGKTSSGTTVTIAVHGGTPLGAPRFTLHILGTEGALIVHPATLGDSINVGDWIVSVARADGSVEQLPVPDYTAGLVRPGPPKNITRMYAELARAVREGTQTTVDFRMALLFHEVIDAIERSALIGAVQRVQSAD
jgi:predicted dehydrogenase